MTQNAQDALWIPLILAGLGLLGGLVMIFFILEIPGLRRGKQPMTLSASVRRWLGISPRNEKRRRWALPLFLALWLGCIGFFCWFCYHIVFTVPAATAFARLK